MKTILGMIAISYLGIAIIASVVVHIYMSAHDKKWSAFASVGAGICWPILAWVFLFGKENNENISGN